MTARFRFERLGSQDRSTFSSGSAPLDKYLREQATQDAKRLVAVCYVAIEQETGRLAGYYTLAGASIALVDLPNEERRQLPRYPSVPAARIGRLAVDQAFRGQGLGASLLDHALETALNSGMGVYAIVVDAKDDAAAGFYERHGFKRFGERRPPVLYLPMRRRA